MSRAERVLIEQFRLHVDIFRQEGNSGKDFAEGSFKQIAALCLQAEAEERRELSAMVEAYFEGGTERGA